MASLWKREDTKYLFACFTDRDGRRRKRGTGTTDRKAAMKIAEQFEEAARRKRTARQVRTVIADLHREITNEELPTSTAREFMQGWLERKKPETSTATLAFYSKTVEKFLAFLGTGADADLGEVTRDHITQFRNHLAAWEARHVQVVWMDQPTQAAELVEKWIWWFARQMVEDTNDLLRGSKTAEAVPAP